MFHHRLAFMLALTVGLAASVRASELSLEMREGRVTLVAKAAPLRDVLAEWARVGQTTIVDADKLGAQTVTLQLVDVPEAQALRTLLRSASGYLAAPRPLTSPGPSQYDRILILATSRAPSSVPPPIAQPVFPDPALDPSATQNEQATAPPYGLTPDQAQQFQQLQQLLQQPAPGAPPTADQQGLPSTSDRPGMPTAPPTPGGAARPAGRPYTPINPFIVQPAQPPGGRLTPETPPTYPPAVFPPPQE